MVGSKFGETGPGREYTISRACGLVDQAVDFSSNTGAEGRLWKGFGRGMSWYDLHF